MLRDDPGAVLLLLRWSGDHGARPSFLKRMLAPEVLDEAVRLLDLPGEDAVDWASPIVRPIHLAATALATLAREHALQIPDCDPEEAWACGLLAPLGWLGVCTADPAAAAACLADPEFLHNPSQTQRRRWGLDQAALARRLARRWHLPDWLATVIGCLRLPLELACNFGPDLSLLRCVRRAIEQVRGQAIELGLGSGLDTKSISEFRDIATGEATSPLQATCRGEVSSPPPSGSAFSSNVWESPYRSPLLRDLLATAAENRRLREAAYRVRLETEVDHLHAALEEQTTGEDGRAAAGKLAALAELAAGAGHEINNPLAVISGQAQYLLAHGADWFQGDPERPRKALNTIIGQTHRIHSLLRDLMQFARPAAPRPAWFDLPTLLAETASSLAELAEQRRVRIEIGRKPDRLAAFADAEQVRIALTCLLRNAVEAAPSDSWARIRLVEPVVASVVEVAVEDGGAGPAPDQRAALFDPFFSGRPAGRGRGLGLPIAWRLARQQDGDVRLDAAPPIGPTRFTLTLPRISETEAARRIAATPDQAVPERRAS